MAGLRLAGVWLAVVALVGCGIDRDSGKALGTAGQTAAQSIEDQASSASKTLAALPEWQGVHDALVCSNVANSAARTACLNNVRNSVHQPSADPALASDLATLSDVMSKRAAAAAQLANAYQAFVALATYNAGAEAATAIQATFASVNKLSAAAAALGPPGLAASIITPTFTTITSGLGALLADERQAQQMLAASRDLHTAVDAMIKALTLEADKAASLSLFITLQAERDQLYSAAVQAGLISPSAALKPLFTDVAPGAELVAAPPTANSDVIRTAVVISLNQQSQRQQHAVAD